MQMHICVFRQTNHELLQDEQHYSCQRTSVSEEKEQMHYILYSGKKCINAIYINSILLYFQIYIHI